jgi:hypothetical protein
MKKILLFVLLLILAACAPAPVLSPILTTTGTQTPEVAATATPEPIKTPIPPVATETPTPEVDYPVFDKAEDILTPEKLPVVSIENVYSGKFAEIVLRMYKEGKIRQISPHAKPYPFQWGNKLADGWGNGRRSALTR